MNDEIEKILYNPTVGKITTIIIGIAIIWMVIKGLQKNIFSKIGDTDNRYKAKKFSSFLGYLLTIILSGTFTYRFIDILLPNHMEISFIAL